MTTKPQTDWPRPFRFTREQLREVASNSIEASFLAPERKVAVLRAMEAIDYPQ